jgi:hypothetical protein
VNKAEKAETEKRVINEEIYAKIKNKYVKVGRDKWADNR